jgi:NAD(P)-dependent dehydrogenase (short-subunit alcohol dehydrogenase family)
LTEKAVGSVVVTGGASSVGLAVAERFAAEGRRVHICDVDVDALAAAAESGRFGAARQVDVASHPQVAAFLAEVLADGPVDVLVNTVGVGGPRAPLQDVSLDEWERTLSGCLHSSFYTMRTLLPHFIERRCGCIVNVSSTSTRTGLPNRTPYVVAKAGLEALTRNVAREVGPFGVRVNAVLPGAIDNARLDRLVADGARERGVEPEAFERHLFRFISMRSRVEPDEVAAMIGFLASDTARHVTGQLIGVCGNVEWEE